MKQPKTALSKRERMIEQLMHAFIILTLLAIFLKVLFF